MNQVTFVVHGVGEPKRSPGEADPATRDLADAWARAHGNAPIAATRMVSQVGSKSVDYTIFTSKTVAAHGASNEHHVVELQWADLSTLWGGKWGAVVGLFSLIIGLRHVANAAGRPLAAQRRWAHRLSRAIFWLMRRPVLAINVVLAVGLLVVIAFPWAGILSGTDETVTARVSVTVGVLLALPLLSPGWRRQRLVQWVAALGGVIATMPFWKAEWLLGLDGATGDTRSFLDYFFTLGSVLNLCWLVVAAASAVLIVAWPFGRRGLSLERQRNFDALVLTSLLAIRVWSFGMPLIWSGLLLIARSATANLGSGALLSLAALQSYTKAFIPMMGTNWVLLFAILASAAIGYGLFVRVSTREGRAFGAAAPATRRSLAARHQARLFIGRLLLGALALTTIAADAFMLFQLYGGHQERSPASHILVITPRPAGALLAWTFDKGVVLGVALAIVAFFLRHRIRTALDFAIDFTNYFRPPTGGPSVPDLVLARFERIVSDVVTALRPDRVVFVTHSQGTVYAGEFLTSGRYPPAPCPPADLVTMGSPISHIYDHYLSGTFWVPQGPPLVGTHVNGWTNLFRWNDYIGRTVTPAGEDHEVGPGGHPGYFKDDTVMAKIRSLALVP